MDRYKLNIKRFGWDSDFRREYESMCATLHYDKRFELFDKWDNIYKTEIQKNRIEKIEKIKRNINGIRFK